MGRLSLRGLTFVVENLYANDNPGWWNKCRISHVCSHLTPGNTVHPFEVDCQIINGL